MSRWYPVQTQPQRERLAAQQLENQGYAVFFPRRRRVVRHARRIETRETSYFPGYIFVRLDLAQDHWRSVNGTLGVRSLVMFGGSPASVPTAFVDFLRSCADENGCLAVRGHFAPGDKVRINAGPFADVVGLIDRLEGGARIRILLELASGSLPVVTTPENLSLAS
jgi:transcription elongation factor/antiterminator RfaH